MLVKNLLLISLYCLILLGVTEAQLITQPPESTTAALGTNATFSCRGNGEVLWEINGTQVRDAGQVPVFRIVQAFVPLPKDSFSELIVTGSRENNGTLVIVCVMDPGISVGVITKSQPVRLLVYAEPNPPANLNITSDDLNLVLTWREPFSLKGEELFYVVSITNTASGIQKEVTVNTSKYVLTEPIGKRDCAEYVFTIFSRNGFSKSRNAITGRKNIPTEPLVMRAADVGIDVTLTNEVSATINFNSSDPCPFYPVITYTFNITVRATNTLVTSIRHNSNQPLTVDSGNGLVPNQIYKLIIEAENSAGKTLSEEIPFYTTGLQSSIAVMELNGSITITCTFATGASSTGCQVTIFTMGSSEKVLSTNITRPNGATQVLERLTIAGLEVDNTQLHVQTVELLSGGDVGDVVFNGTVPLSGTTATTATTSESGFPITTLSSDRSSQVPLPGSLQYIIIGAVVAAFVLVLLVLIVITTCIIVSLKRRKSQDISNQDTRENRYEVSVCPAYATITERVDVSSDTLQALHNPVYNGVVIRSDSDIQVATYPVYAKIGHVGSTLHNQRNHTIDVPLSPSSETGSFVSQVPSPYLVPQRSPKATRAKTCGQVQNPSPYSEPVPHQSDNLNSSKQYASTSNQEGFSGDKEVWHTNNNRHAGTVVSSDLECAESSNPSRTDNIHHTESVGPVYESIKVRNTQHPPTRQDSSSYIEIN